MAVTKKARKKEEGAPAWMVTYGDMVTLLLTFFVMLLAMSEVKKDDQFLDFMQAIREAFGYEGGARHTPLDEVMVPRNVDFTEMLIIPFHSHDFSKARDPGVRGKRRTTRDNRPGDVFVRGGRIHFPALSAELSAAEAARIPQFAEDVRGFNTLIRVTGHCSRQPVDGTPFADHVELSYRRARAVERALIEQGVSPQRIMIVAAGTNLPVAVPAYSDVELLKNDRVEILQVDVRVDEFVP